MEAANGGGSKSGKRRTKFGAEAVKKSSKDAAGASCLVGSIVEKGISGKKPLAPVPKPTVIPFPVARHRSHGPHWVPLNTDNTGHSDEDAEDEDVMEFNKVAAFAKPVRKKEKKGLDFSRWRELLANDNTSAPHIESEEKHKYMGAKDQKKTSNEVAENLEKVQSFARTSNVLMNEKDHDMCEEVSSNVSAEATDVIKGEIEIDVSENLNGHMQMDRERHVISTSHTFLSEKSTFRTEQESISLESQIDAENRAQLKSMSADEIAEAQAEILERINPAIIAALKKRGQNKSNIHKDSTSDKAAKREIQDSKEIVRNGSRRSPSNGDISDKLDKETLEGTKREKNANPVQKLSSGRSSLWNSWSTRVEAAREIRFSLDGNVINNGFPTVPTGCKSTNSGYTVDNVSERDFLRTEGDPAAAGYTIKEALALTRSVIPSQRALALHLLSSVLSKAIQNICQNQTGHNNKGGPNNFIDWNAIWAYALGPEPELALSLRMSLDDNHNSVVLASAKVTQCVLCCEINESYFDISEKLTTYPRDINTAPVFRSSPEINDGFLLSGFWKYNAKPSNILPFIEDDVVDNDEGEHTIQDDTIVAGQDFVAGLVRMGIFPRICYLLESDPSAALEECLISILVAVARHSPTCANAVMKCEGLLQTIVVRFTAKEPLEACPSKIKSVTLFKVLARSEKNNCIDFIRKGFFQRMTWHLYQYKFSHDKWIKLGSDGCKLLSALIIEQLRFWKVCIQYGYCISNFSDLFPSLCLWLSVPTVEKLNRNNVLSEFTAITEEIFLVLGAMARTLPNIYSNTHLRDQMFDVADEETETWCWAHVGPMVDFSIKWIALLNYHDMSKNFGGPIIGVISAIMLMLSDVLDRVIPDDTNSFAKGNLPWLPEFVPKIGLEIIKNGNLSFIGNDSSQSSSFIEHLCLLRQQSDCELSITSSSCLGGLVKVMVSVDKLIELAKSGASAPSSESQTRSREEMILAGGIVKFSMRGSSNILDTFIKLVSCEWKLMQSVEVFGRGGPAPGIGVGWGAVGGGFWSKNLLLARADVELLINLLEIFQIELATSEEMTSVVERVVSAWSICVTLGPKDGILIEKSLDYLLRAALLKLCFQCINHFVSLNDNFKPFSWAYNYEDFHFFSKMLSSHYKKRWFSVKEKKKKRATSEKNCPLETIPEELETLNLTNLTLTVEWAHQRLPLPTHWYLSPISYSNTTNPGGNHEFIEVAKAGLFFILGIEVMASFIPTWIESPVRSVPLTWKLHSLSVSLLAGMAMLEEEQTRDVYRTLQGVYGKFLDESLLSIDSDLILDENNKSLAENDVKNSVEFLRFQSEIHDSYSTFVENLVDQFAAVSYGDEIYGRQISVYLHRCVEAPVRLAAWSNLSNARVLELLPPLEYCIGKAEGYLEPAEDDESILEAYVKSWVSGALDRAKTRRSMAYTLVLHHITSFIFSLAPDKRFSLRNKLVTSLLRDYTRNQKHEGMMHDLIQYRNIGDKQASSTMSSEAEMRFKLLAEACAGNSSLLRDLEKLRLSFQSNNLSL